MKDIVIGLIRHALTFGGGYLVTKGLTDSAGAEALVGALVTAIGGIWSIVHKLQTTPAKPE